MSYGPFYNPPVPFVTQLYNGAYDGLQVVVSGMVLQSGERFAVNFQCGQGGNDDIAFHFNPRFDGSYIVCNTMEHKNWGKEERKHELPFHRGQPFEIRILVTNHEYKVSVNRNHFLEYHHRIPLQRVNTISINGCISLTSVEIQGQGGGHHHHHFPSDQMQNPAYPPQPGFPGQPGYSPQFPQGAGCNQPPFNPGQFPTANYAIPYQTNIYGGLFPSKVIVIRGAVAAHHPKRFHVNLRFGGGIAFHFNPRFDEQTIVRNSCLNDSWGSEERQLNCGMCFAPGQNFVIEIVCEHHHFRVNVNGNHVCNYNHRVPHLQQIDTLQVDGDVVLQHVQI
ncbi:galectin-9-like [Dendropsophus ebraccatus]|uniref:galectin-9-like n=1 Tax=Dendropsophus ebraccatus TaxID=150705 RepID=UPI0038317425